jgi:hypothetical protein
VSNRLGMLARHADGMGGCELAIGAFHPLSAAVALLPARRAAARCCCVTSARGMQHARQVETRCATRTRQPGAHVRGVNACTAVRNLRGRSGDCGKF